MENFHVVTKPKACSLNFFHDIVKALIFLEFIDYVANKK